MDRLKLLKSLRNKKVAIDDVVNSYSNRIASHKAAWPYLIKSKLFYLGIKDVTVLTKKDNIEDYDVWLIVLPMEFKGTFNIFGGANDDLATRLQRFVDYEGEVYIVDQDMPDVGEFILSRKRTCTPLFKDLDHELFTELSSDVETLNLHLNSKGFVLGDSHSISVYKPGYDISRNDGKTLHGALNQGLESFLPINHNIDHLITYFGNIDIRHHLCRQENPIESLSNLLTRYEKQLVDLNIDNISIVSPLWIENESRKVPKSGYYEGTAFYGSLDQRLELVDKAITTLEIITLEHGWELITWPESMMDDNDELEFQYMEKPKSIHLSREFYHYDFNTNQKNNKFFNLK